MNKKKIIITITGVLVLIIVAITVFSCHNSNKKTHSAGEIDSTMATETTTKETEKETTTVLMETNTETETQTDAPVSTVAEMSGTKYANARANVRDLPNGNVIGELSVNDQVTVTGKDGEWYRISYNGSDGYVNESLLNNEPISTLTNQIVQNDNQSNDNEDNNQSNVNNKENDENNVPDPSPEPQPTPQPQKKDYGPYYSWINEYDPTDFNGIDLTQTAPYTLIKDWNGFSMIINESDYQNHTRLNELVLQLGRNFGDKVYNSLRFNYETWLIAKDLNGNNMYYVNVVSY